MNKEIWKDIEGYEGLYKISSTGRIKSCERITRDKNGKERKTKEIFLKGFFCRGGYQNVDLCKKCKVKKYIVHRLVAKAFIPNHKNKPQVNHIDGIKTNNKIKNLEWSTSGENIRHAFKTGLNKAASGSCNGKSILTELIVKNIKERHKEKAKDLAVEYGVSTRAITDIRSGRTWGQID